MRPVSLFLAAEVTAPRVRAALAYGGFEYREAAAETGLSYDTIKRLAAKKNPRGASTDELWAIADACGVPRAFMEHGFATDKDGRTVEERLEALEDFILDDVQAVVDDWKRRRRAVPGVEEARGGQGT